MYTAFDHMKDHSRVWIYTASRDLSQEESVEFEVKCRAFVENWTAHSTHLQGSCTVINNRFVVLSVDELSHQASGCSIDSSVNFIRSLEQEKGISLMNGGKVAVEIEGSIELLSTKEVKERSEIDLVNENTVVYDHLVTNIGELKERFTTSAGQSWLKRFLSKKETV